MLDDMAAAGVEWDAFTLSALLSACQAGGRWEQALEWFQRAQRTPGEAKAVGPDLLAVGWVLCAVPRFLPGLDAVRRHCTASCALPQGASTLRSSVAPVDCRPAAERRALHHADELPAEGGAGAAAAAGRKQHVAVSDMWAPPPPTRVSPSALGSRLCV